MQTISIQRLTPLLFVNEIEPCLEFWVERLGFAKTVEVPEGDKLGFVILVKDGTEVMYQSRASVANDIPALAEGRVGRANLYVEVDDVDAAENALAGFEVAVPKRQTFYGATEIFIRDPGGNVIGFAEMAESAEH